MFISNPTGRRGEEIATKFLKEKGYKIIEKNFRKGYGEIDIIAVKDNVLIFVEVKTRTTKLFGGAIEAIGLHKLKKLINTSVFYKSLHPGLPDALRIDAVLINLDKNNKPEEIIHMEDISG